MFRWLTRNDGGRGAKAARHLVSSRGSVFSEFAIIMPIVLLVCSALVEITGYWDACIMANHTAWQVGRIAMVRGVEGMRFADNASTDTGVQNRSMSGSLSAALGQIYPKVNAIADRGKIAAMFLMSTCGIGYFGMTPVSASPGKFGGLINSGFSAFGKSLKEYNNTGTKALFDDIIDTVKVEITNKIVNQADNILLTLASNIIAEVGGAVVKMALEPVAGLIADATFDAVVKVQSIADAAAPVCSELEALNTRLARQLYGAGLRLDRSPEAVRVLSVEVSPYIFNDSNRLAYPLVADEGVTADGYFVTGAHGWPAAGEVHKLICVDMSWPYEAWWLFPTVSGYGVSKSPPAKGISMVFPQPYIMPRNLYSQGAAAFDGPKYDASADSSFDGLQKEIEAYLKCALFCLKYRICVEKVTGDWAGYSWSYRKSIRFCPELAEVFGLRYPKTKWEHETYYWWWYDDGKFDVPCYSGDYYMSWMKLTNGAGQNYYDDDYDYFYYTDSYYCRHHLGQYFEPESYHNIDYFFWEGDYRKSYQWTLCQNKGKVQFEWPYDSNGFAPFCHRGGGQSVTTAASSDYDFGKIYNNYAYLLSTNITAVATKEWLRQKINAFVARNRLNIPHLCEWQTPSAFEVWCKEDSALEYEVTEVSKQFPLIVSLVEDEIAEMQKRMSDKQSGGDSFGDIDEFLVGENDLDALTSPGAAADKAREKWEQSKERNRKCLEELEEIVVNLRRLYAGYTEKNGDEEIVHPGINERLKSFQLDRKNATYWNFSVACIKILSVSQDLTIFDEGHEEKFLSYFRSNSRDVACEPLGYPIAKRTSEMRALIDEYRRLLIAAYDKEAEFGKLLGLKSAMKRDRSGVPIEDTVDQMDVMEGITPSGSGPGDDDSPILNSDRQKYESGKGWEWVD